MPNWPTAPCGVAKNPADFSVVQASCGGSNCHSGTAESYSDHIQRATTSIQATYAGAIAIMRYTYGAQSSLTALFGVTAVQDSQSTSGITSLQAVRSAGRVQPAATTVRAELSHLSPVRPAHADGRPV